MARESDRAREGVIYEGFKATLGKATLNAISRGFDNFAYSRWPLLMLFAVVAALFGEGAGIA